MDLNTIWFGLIAVLFIGFFLLEGFDFGVGMLLPFIGRGGDSDAIDTKRRVMINSIGPHWDGNEVWLLTAGGAIFAAFPMWYATMFSGFYIPLFIILLALIGRAVAFEFRSKDKNPKWRSLWDWMIFIGSIIPALLFGVAFANLARGVPIDESMNYIGGFFYLLNPYALLGGIATVLVCALHGSIFLNLKTTGEVCEDSQKYSRRSWIIVVVVLLVFLITTYFSTDIISKLGVNPGPVPIVGMITILLCGYFIRKQWYGWAFLMTSLTILFSLLTLFMIMYPRVMISSLDPTFSLTIYNASSSEYTLKVMTIVALIMVPIVLVYQGWTYWVFRKRIEPNPEKLTY
jgi:cytochrome d ubiquinol oxidase subunit II